MKKLMLYSCFVLSIILIMGFSGPLLYKNATGGDDSFYSKSLHYTNNGIRYIYSKEHGGLERLTGMSAAELGCDKAKCHATTCDGCHRKEVNGKPVYTTDTTVAMNACKNCHGDMVADNPDVHFAKGMKCMDCHTTREIHGDGVEYKSYQEPGFFDVSCRKCHVTLSNSPSHAAHSGKLDCAACHSAGYETCLNCHVESRLAQKKGSVITLRNMCFLVNYNGQVTTANMLSYVYKGKTMITFAKTFTHSILKNGRKCPECHNSGIVKNMQSGKFKLVKWKNDSMINVNGVIPVLQDYDMQLVFLDRKDDKWIPLENPPAPLINYSGYCSPITRDQFEKMVKPR
jgi:hypothetical protein